jgi:polyamine oxidase
MSKPVLILGAGAASAAAALALSKAGRHSIVLEAQSRIGGRISTRLEFGAPIDLGASYVRLSL